MNNNILRAPLIKSATLLAVVSLLVYLTATSSEGSLWNSLGTLFVAAFRVVQLGLGLIISLLFCMAVLSGIFLGCMAIISRESAARMFEQLRQEVSNRLLFVRSLVIRDVPSGGSYAVASDTELKEELLAAMKEVLAGVRANQAISAEKVENVLQRLDTIEQDDDMGVLLERQDGQIQGLVVQMKQVQEQSALLQGKVDELLHSPGNEEVNALLSGLGRRMDLLENAMVPVQEELARIRERSATEELPEKGDDRAEKGPVAHRLFIYFAKKDMQKKVEDLVTETLGKDMSYAQVIDHLISNTRGSKAAEIIKAHPSLVKEYIRYRRNKG